MHIKRDWPITLDAERFIQNQGPSFDRLLARPSLRASFDEALDEAQHLIAPAACWDYVPIVEILHERLVLRGGTRIGGGPVVSVVAGASELIVAVCTVGQAISDRISACHAERDLFKSMILNDLGSWAVDVVRQQLCQLLEDEFKSEGLRTSAPLSPGESTWSVKDQAAIFSLLDTGRIDVSLSESMVMRPLKSLSLIMGAGAGPLGVEGASNCDFCTMGDRCNFRRMRTAPEPSLA